jgi:hypothetical protein
MRTRLLFVTAAVLVGAAALAQLRITSFNSSGELTWTNFARVGAYRVEWANSPTGLWNAFSTPSDLNSIWAETNRVTVKLPLSNASGFYRVAWTPPDPIGVWDYRGYDAQGTLLITGQLAIVSTTLLTSNPPVYVVSGWRDLKNAGPPTNQLDPTYIGTGELAGRLELVYARLDLVWPSGCADCGMIPSGTLWPNTYTGRWYYETFVGPMPGGVFSAERR